MLPYVCLRKQTPEDALPATNNKSRSRKKSEDNENFPKFKAYMESKLQTWMLSWKSYAQICPTPWINTRINSPYRDNSRIGPGGSEPDMLVKNKPRRYVSAGTIAQTKSYWHRGKDQNKFTDKGRSQWVFTVLSWLCFRYYSKYYRPDISIQGLQQDSPLSIVICYSARNHQVNQTSTVYVISSHLKRYNRVWNSGRSKYAFAKKRSSGPRLLSPEDSERDFLILLGLNLTYYIYNSLSWSK